MDKVLIINGPNLNLLGKRETRFYGDSTYQTLCDSLTDEAKKEGLDLEIYQSNHEGEIVEKIQATLDSEVKAIIINPAAFTHTSVAIRDALLAVNIPFIELHISNPHAREEFRHRSYLADAAYGIISGFGQFSYRLALQAAKEMLDSDDLDVRR